MGNLDDPVYIRTYLLMYKGLFYFQFVSIVIIKKAIQWADN